jgi:hypothetical protein
MRKMQNYEDLVREISNLASDLPDRLSEAYETGVDKMDKRDLMAREIAPIVKIISEYLGE